MGLVENDEWDALRDVIAQSTGQNLNKLTKEGRYTSKTVGELKAKLRKALFDVDNFAYSQQSFPGADLFAGYCAEGVTPRGDGGCKLKPVVDKTAYLAKLKEANSIFDQLIKACEA